MRVSHANIPYKFLTSIDTRTKLKISQPRRTKSEIYKTPPNASTSCNRCKKADLKAAKLALASGQAHRLNIAPFDYA